MKEFDCGEKEWEREVGEWLRASEDREGALQSMIQYGTAVWLYATGDGNLVGVAALGARSLKYPNPNKSDPVPTSAIPILGVDKRWRGKGYGKQILSDLLDEARKYAAERPLVVLSVHEQNPAAGFYQSRGFKPFGKPRSLVKDGPLYVRMVLEISGDQ